MDVEVWLDPSTILVVEVGELTISSSMEVDRVLSLPLEVEMRLLILGVYDVDISLLKPVCSAQCLYQGQRLPTRGQALPCFRLQ